MADPANQPDTNPDGAADPAPDPADTPTARRDRAVAFIVIALLMATLTAVVWVTRPKPPPLGDDPALPFRVPINTADPSALQLLPGVGPALAERIIAERNRRPFTDPRDLQRVSGIAAKSAAKMAPYVDFSPPPHGPSPPAPR